MKKIPRTPKRDEKREVDLLETVKELLNNKGEGILFVLKQSKEKTATKFEGACIIRNVDHHHVVRNVVQAFKLNAMDVLFTNLDKNDRDSHSHN